MIEELHDGMMLYHGSYFEVRNPDLEMCARYKDFGRGFYLTTDAEQARQFALISTRKAKVNGIVDAGQRYGIVSNFKGKSTAYCYIKKRIMGILYDIL